MQMASANGLSDRVSAGCNCDAWIKRAGLEHKKATGCFTLSAIVFHPLYCFNSFLLTQNTLLWKHFNNTEIIGKRVLIEGGGGRQFTWEGELSLKGGRQFTWEGESSHATILPVWRGKTVPLYNSQWVYGFMGKWLFSLPMVINPSFNSGSLKSLHYGVLHTILKSLFCM